MSFSPFNPANPGNPDNIRYRYDESENPGRERAYRQAFGRLFEHMHDISDDPSGSDPANYLSAEDAATCARITTQARAAGWPNATLLEMRTARVPLHTEGLHVVETPAAWTGSLRTAKAGPTKALFFPIEETHQGYVFGHLGIGPVQISQAVALCDDGLLRSHRGRELQLSKGIGWGRLPDPELLMPVLGSGHLYGVDYTNGSSHDLSKVLVKKSKNGFRDPGPALV